MPAAAATDTPAATATTPASPAETVTSGASKKTPRTRRPKIVYSDRVAASCTSDDENVILKLSFEDTGVSKHTPDPYDRSDVDTFAPNPCSLSDVTVGAPLFFPPTPIPQSGDAAPGPSPSASSATRTTGLKVIRLLTEFEEKNKNSEWPSSTSVHCYWCCHRFENAPFGLPVKFASNMYHVIGCFCSLECACAYNFASPDSIDERLNRYTLLNTLSNRLGLGRTVQPAPTRLSLSVFGGHLDIDEFREFSSAARRNVIINSPPMLTMTQQVEEVNETDMRSEYRYIPLDSERINRYQEKVRLKRCKPLVNFKNTLDHTMKLKYV